MYVIDNAIKWYSKKNYLELFHPKDNAIVKIEHEGIDKIWEITINSNDIIDVIEKLKNEKLDFDINGKFIFNFFEIMNQKNYIVIMEEF